MGFWSSLGKAFESYTSDVPSMGGFVVTNGNSLHGECWGIYCGSHKVLTVLPQKYDTHDVGEVVVIPDRVFMSFAYGTPRHYYHFVNSDYKRALIKPEKFVKLMNMSKTSSRYGDDRWANRKFICDALDIAEGETPTVKLKKMGYDSCAVHPENF